MSDLPDRLDKLAGRLMTTTEHHQYAQTVLEAANELRRLFRPVAETPEGLEAQLRPLMRPEGADVSEKYHELLYAVARKFPDETRHETALRYIREAESQKDNRPCQVSSSPQ